MYMAPIVKATPAPSHPVLRRTVGLPVLFFAAVLAGPWIAVQLLLALCWLLVRTVVEAVDYAGTVALGR